MLGINGGELIIILVVAVIIIGPERLPAFAEQLARAVRKGKEIFQEAKGKVDEELGPEFKDVDWAKLDPRQYDPRKIVRDTLIEDTPLDPNYEAKRRARSMGTTAAAAAPAATPSPGNAKTAPPPGFGDLSFENYQPLAAGKPAPFDQEAT